MEIAAFCIFVTVRCLHIYVLYVLTLPGYCIFHKPGGILWLKKTPEETFFINSQKAGIRNFTSDYFQN